MKIIGVIPTLGLNKTIKLAAMSNETVSDFPS
jgi:hypothetical protein